MTLHMIIQRDLVGPKTHPQSHTRKRSTQQGHAHSHLLPFNSLIRNRSKSHMSVASNGHTSAMNGSEEDTLHIPVPVPVEKRKRHSAYYTSHSELHPEFHANPYLSSTALHSSPQRQMQAGAGAQYPPRFAGEGYGVHGLLSQPAPVIYGPQDGMGMHPQVLYENRNVHDGHGNLTADEFGSGMYTGGHNQMSYGTSAVHNSSSRKKIFRNNSAISRVKEEVPVISIRTPEYSALSQPSDTSKDFRITRGGGSMRAPLNSKSPARGHDLEKLTSLTQFGKERDEGEEGAVGHTPFTRTASLNPHQAVVGGYKNSHHLRDNKPHPHKDVSGGVATPIDKSETLPVDWEVLVVFLLLLLLY